MVKIEIKLAEYNDNGVAETQMTRYYWEGRSHFIKNFSNDLATFLQLSLGKDTLEGEYGFFRAVTAEEFALLEEAFQKIKAEREKEG